jgi:hypothetical protein
MQQTIDGMGVNINVNSWKNGELKPALDALININGSSAFRVIRDPMTWVSSESLISRPPDVAVRVRNSRNAGHLEHHPLSESKGNSR